MLLKWRDKNNDIQQSPQPTDPKLGIAWQRNVDCKCFNLPQPSPKPTYPKLRLHPSRWCLHRGTSGAPSPKNSTNFVHKEVNGGRPIAKEERVFWTHVKKDRRTWGACKAAVEGSTGTISTSKGGGFWSCARWCIWCVWCTKMRWANDEGDGQPPHNPVEGAGGGEGVILTSATHRFR